MRGLSPSSGSFWAIAGQRRARRDADQHAFLARRPARHFLGIVGVDLDHAVEQRSVSRLAGMKPAPMPWIGCGPGLPPEDTGDSVGSTANTLSAGHSFLSTRGAAGDVAAGADAGDQRVDRRVARSRRGFPARWCGDGPSTLAGLSNCCGIQLPGTCSTIIRRRGRSRPSCPFRAGSGRSSRHRRASGGGARSLMLSGMTRISR